MCFLSGFDKVEVFVPWVLFTWFTDCSYNSRNSPKYLIVKLTPATIIQNVGAAPEMYTQSKKIFHIKTLNHKPMQEK